MSLTKGEAVTEAYEMIGLYSVDTLLENRGVKILERMLHGWYTDGIYTGYTFAENPNDALSTDDSTIRNDAEVAVVWGLANDLAAVNGIPFTMDWKSLKDSLRNITPPRLAANPAMPSGAGNQRWNSENKYQSPALNDDGSVGGIYNDSLYDFHGTYIYTETVGE